ncbi:hypothetical protein ElyMa_001524900 [Elysia marginata]|uniref:Uncharacterized protein n=1 Tax=Elysia marginata TaxID=1093978 RepID=A0AAV4J958_9GAST|nr:hypothetical protein ElyMa_001524900 [Elysia marginata]
MQVFLRPSQATQRINGRPALSALCAPVKKPNFFLSRRLNLKEKKTRVPPRAVVKQPFLSDPRTIDAEMAIVKEPQHRSTDLDLVRTVGLPRYKSSFFRALELALNFWTPYAKIFATA